MHFPSQGERHKSLSFVGVRVCQRVHQEFGKYQFEINLIHSKYKSHWLQPVGTRYLPSMTAGNLHLTISAVSWSRSHAVTLTFLRHFRPPAGTLHCPHLSERHKIMEDRVTVTRSTAMSPECDCVDGGHMPKNPGFDMSHKPPSAFTHRPI